MAVRALNQRMELNCATDSTAVVPMPRSCARCGTGFRAFSKNYICPACRRPGNRDRQRGSADLSPRERQIVALVQQAKANKEIAYELCLSEGTIKEYLHHIFRKLNVTSRTELALRSYRESLAMEAAKLDDSRTAQTA